MKKARSQWSSSCPPATRRIRPVEAARPARLPRIPMSPRLPMNSHRISTTGPDALRRKPLPHHQRIARTERSRAFRSAAARHWTLRYPHLDKFSCWSESSAPGLLGVLSGRGGGGGPALWESQHKAELDNPTWKKGLKLVWFSTGKDDSLFPTSQNTVELLNKHGYNASFHESTGGTHVAQLAELSGGVCSAVVPVVTAVPRRAA